MSSPSPLWRSVLPSALSVLLALLLGFVGIAVVQGGADLALEAYGAMLWGGFGDWPAFVQHGSVDALLRPWGELSNKAALLLLTGLSVAVAFRAGLFNIGAQGQLMVGALCAAVAGAQLQLPPLLHLPVCLALAGAGGAAYAAVAAWLKVRRGVHEVISTIMLNWIAASLIENWLVPGPLAAGGTHSIAGTQEVLASSHLPRLLGEASRLHGGILVAVGCALATLYWLFRTEAGFETRALGHSPDAAYANGVPVRRRLYEAMLGAGALAGLAGAVLVLGTEYRYPPTLAAPYGFDGIAIALVGQSHPLGVTAAAVVFGALRAGGTRMQLFGVHQSFPELIQGLALLFVAGKWAWELLLQRASRARRGEHAAVD